MNFEQWFSNQESKITLKSVESVLKLASTGATVPFMARYRKEVTGNLDEVQIQKVLDLKEKWDNTLKRQKFIEEQIDSQKKLTPELKKQIQSCFELNELETIYQPYKSKRKTKATIAKEAGLEPLFNWFWEKAHNEENISDEEVGKQLEQYLNPEKELKTIEDVKKGLQAIVTEKASENADLREQVRKVVGQFASLKVSKTKEAAEKGKFDKYYDYSETVKSLESPSHSHRYLAIRRGWNEKQLSVSFDLMKKEENQEDLLIKQYENYVCTNSSKALQEVLLMAARLAFKVYVYPSIQNEVHKKLKEIADQAAIEVFAENVKKLLLSSPFGAKAVLGVDPGIRTGCKLAIVDQSGKYISNTVIKLKTEAEKNEAKQVLKSVCEKIEVQAIAVGNGTAGRETEIALRTIVKDLNLNVPVVMVNESGASIYSASEVAREEFPELDLTVRGAISIARRFQDPLAELVKIDPKSIGVGQYQHDVNQNQLKKSLSHVVDSCVNQVGVNLNTASQYLLSHVSGIGDGMAKSIVSYRQEKGVFKSRKDLMNVPRFTDKHFEQAAGFLRIANGENPLDNTGVHPERYSLLEGFAKKNNKKVSELLGAGVEIIKKSEDFKQEVGEFTFKDIIEELSKPGRDPRKEFEAFQFREDIHEMKDLKEEMICPGIVTNVTNFGAFVDIGVHQDGLVHISEMSYDFVSEPKKIVSPGQKVKVKVMSVDLEKKQIALSMKTGEKPKTQRTKRNFSDSKAVHHKKNFSKQKKKSSSNKAHQKPKKRAGFSHNPFADLANKMR